MWESVYLRACDECVRVYVCVVCKWYSDKSILTLQKGDSLIEEEVVRICGSKRKRGRENPPREELDLRL